MRTYIERRVKKSVVLRISSFEKACCLPHGTIEIEWNPTMLVWSMFHKTKGSIAAYYLVDEVDRKELYNGLRLLTNYILDISWQ